MNVERNECTVQAPHCDTETGSSRRCACCDTGSTRDYLIVGQHNRIEKAKEVCARIGESAVRESAVRPVGRDVERAGLRDGERHLCRNAHEQRELYRHSREQRRYSPSGDARRTRSENVG